MKYLPHILILALVLIYVNPPKTVTSKQEYMACMYGATQSIKATMTQKQFNKKREDIRQDTFKMCFTFKEVLDGQIK